MLAIVDQGILSKQPDRGAYMPTITPLPDGTYIACQHVGQGLATPDNHIEILRSTDQCQTWTREHTIGAPEDGWAYRAPRINVAHNGHLTLVASRFENTDQELFDTSTEALQRPEMLFYRSTDQGHTWSAPQILPIHLPPEKYTANGTGWMLQLAPDRWMYPFETWKPEGYTGPPDQKAGALFSTDQGHTWDEYTVIADDPTGEKLWWDQAGTILPDGRIYLMLWTHLYGTSKDLPNHYTISEDQGRTWSDPKPTNLHGQVCAPIALPDGRIAAVYNYRHEPQGVRVALSNNLSHFEHDLYIFDAGAEASMGKPENETFLAEHLKIAFGKPGGTLLPSGELLVWFWCTTEGITHTRWVKLKATI